MAEVKAPGQEFEEFLPSSRPTYLGPTNTMVNGWKVYSLVPIHKCMAQDVISIHFTPLQEYTIAILATLNQDF